MINFFRFLVPSLAASLIGLVSLPAQAIAVIQPLPSTFYFTGNCEDCAAAKQSASYGVTARLVLQNYFLGSAINGSNFVSFSYGGSNLLAPYSILPSSLSSVTGHITFGLQGANDFHLVGVNNSYFDLLTTGRWDAGSILGVQKTSNDLGGSGNFGPNAVPEPATILLMGAALTAAGLVRRRRQR